MLPFLFKSILRGIAIVLGVTTILFLLMHAIPGNPWMNHSAERRLMLGPALDLDQATMTSLNRRFGLDQPLWRQWLRYVVGDYYGENGEFICGAVCGNLGPSITQRGRSVQDVLFAPPEGQTFWQSRFGYSIRLMFWSALLAVGLGIPLGIISGTTAKTGLSRAISVILAVIISIPNFILGLLAILVLASWLKIMRVIPNWHNPADWIAPTIVLALTPLAGIARATRAFLINLTGADYIRTAHAKGLHPVRVMRDHLLRNALVPIITYLGPAAMELFTGLFIIEALYAFPGMGREYWLAVLKLDYSMILGLTMLYAVGIVTLNILNTALCELLDPRIHEAAVTEAPA